jgi:hypothetical protein
MWICIVYWNHEGQFKGSHRLKGMPFTGDYIYRGLGLQGVIFTGGVFTGGSFYRVHSGGPGLKWLFLRGTRVIGEGDLQMRKVFEKNIFIGIGGEGKVLYLGYLEYTLFQIFNSPKIIVLYHILSIRGESILINNFCDFRIFFQTRYRWRRNYYNFFSK